MRGKPLQRAIHALSAIVLIVGQFILPANLGGATQNASAAGTNQPVWCQFTNTWVAQLGGDNTHRLKLTELPAGASSEIYIGSDGQVYAPDSSDITLRSALDQYCVLQYTADPPIQTAVCGANNDTITAGEHSTVTSAGAWVNNSRTVTFTATSPYKFLVNGQYSSTHTQTFTDAATPCPRTEIPNPQVTHTVVCGANNDTVVLPTGNYTATDTGWVGGSRTIVFTATGGYTFAGGLSYTINLTDENTPCDAEVPTVTPVVICGANNDTYTASTSSTYSLTNAGAWANGSRTFTFTAAQGYVFTGDATTYTVTLTDQNTPCVIQINPTVTPTPVCDVNNDTFVTSTSSEYTLTNSGSWVNGSRTLTFTASQGYVFAGNNATYAVTITDEGTPCVIPIPAAPSVNDPCGLRNATWNIPADTATIDWYLDESGNLHAKTIGNNVFTDQTTDHNYGKPADSSTLCSATAPAVTVTPICGATNNDSVAVTGGSHYTHQVVRDGTTIAVTVTADPNYTFGEATHYTLYYTDTLTPCTTDLSATLPSVDPCDDLGEINAPHWTITPEDTSMYSWKLNEDGSYTVTAKPGYILNIDDIGLKLSYTYILPLNNPENVCYDTVPAPVKPAPVYICGDISKAVWTKPTNTEAYTWEMVDGELIVTANEGYVLDNNGELVTEINFGTAPENVKYKPCQTFYSTGYTYNDACGTLNDSLTLPENTEHVTYSYKAVDGYFVVTVKAAEGYYLEEGDGQYITEGSYKVKMGDFDLSLKCNVGMGSVKPAVAVTVAATPAPTPAQELPHTGATDNSAFTLLGLVASLATYGAVLSLQRRNA